MNGRTNDKLRQLRGNLDELAALWQQELADDENAKMMRETASRIGLTALLRAALRLLGEPS
jgi:hypothetical protein